MENIQKDCAGVFWKILVETERWRCCIIIPTEIIMISHVNNDEVNMVLFKSIMEKCFGLF